MLGWTKEDAPRWDADKQRLFTTEALAAVGMEAPQAGYAIADEWWQVTNDGGDVVGYGWLDTEWGNAQIALLVGDGHRGRGIGDFILRQLASRRGPVYARRCVRRGVLIDAVDINAQRIAHWLRDPQRETYG